MQALGITRKSLTDWAAQHGFRAFEYDRLWQACLGSRTSRDCFLIRLARPLRLDPQALLLSACADRVPTAYQGFFLALRDGLAWYPEMVEGLQALDAPTLQALLQLIREPEQARRWAQQQHPVAPARLP